MASTTFINYQTVIDASWLNDVNSAVYSGTFQASTISPTNLAYTGTLTGGTGVVNLGSGQFYKDASGNVGIGTTSATGKFTITASSSSYAQYITAQNGYFGIGLQNTSGTAAWNPMVFFTNGSGVGGIGSTGTTTTYYTSSDYRLKEDIAPITSALAKVATLKPVTYKWKLDGSDGEGFIAHELAEVCPQAVTGEKDAVDKDGKPVYQGIDTSFLVATLTAAIQELNAKVDAQDAEIIALQTKVGT